MNEEGQADRDLARIEVDAKAAETEADVSEFGQASVALLGAWRASEAIRAVVGFEKMLVPAWTDAVRTNAIAASAAFRVEGDRWRFAYRTWLVP
jgi:hypothetical protein